MGGAPGRLGYTSNGVVHPSHARDVGGALRVMENGPKGTRLLALVSVGLISYACTNSLNPATAA